MYVIAAVGNGSQPFRRVDEQREGNSNEQRATSDLSLPPPEGDTSDVGRGKKGKTGDGREAIGDREERRAMSDDRKNI